MASASNQASTSYDSDLDMDALLKEINAIYEGGIETFGYDDIVEPDPMELVRRRHQETRRLIEARASISQSESSFSSDRPEPATSSRSSERTESVNLEDIDYASWEKRAEHFSTSSQRDNSSDSGHGSERSSSAMPSVPRVRLVSSSSSEDSFVPSAEHPVDPMEYLIEHRGLLDSFECNESEELLDSPILESSDSDSTDDDTLLACDDEENSEANDVDAIGEHDHLFNVRILYPNENVFDYPAHTAVYRSAIEHSLVGFTYKWGKYVDETIEVCLLQFCSVEGLVIFHKIRRDIMYIPPLLEEILSNDNILKVGMFPGPTFESQFYLNNAIDIRYALQICGMTPKPIADIVESILGYSINLYRGTRPTDKYFLVTDAQYRTAFLEVYFGLRIFIDVRIDFNMKFENNFDRLCEIYKGKMFRMGRPM